MITPEGQLRDEMVKYYSMDELRNLMADFGLHQDDFSSTRTDAVRQLIAWAARHGRLVEFVNHVHSFRPHLVIPSAYQHYIGQPQRPAQPQGRTMMPAPSKKMQVVSEATFDAANGLNHKLTYINVGGSMVNVRDLLLEGGYVHWLVNLPFALSEVADEIERAAIRRADASPTNYSYFPCEFGDGNFGEYTRWLEIRQLRDRIESRALKMQPSVIAANLASVYIKLDTTMSGFTDQGQYFLPSEFVTALKSLIKQLKQLVEFGSDHEVANAFGFAKVNSRSGNPITPAGFAYMTGVVSDICGRLVTLNNLIVLDVQTPVNLDVIGLF